LTTAREGSGGKAFAFGLSLAFLLSGFLLAILSYGIVARVLFQGDAPGLIAATTLQSVCVIASFGLMTWLIGMRAAGLDAEALRWKPGGGRGMGVGALLAVLALAVPLGHAGWGPDGEPATAWLSNLIPLLGVLLPAALAEELVFRGVPMVLLSRAFGRAVAIVGLATVFGMAHLLNPGITGLGAGNIALAGVFLGVAFYLPGGLWTATGVHLGWNATLAAFAAPVSGLPLPVPGLDYTTGGPTWLTGGSFGPEGGVLATIVLGVSTLLVARYIGKEMQA
jgi:membrane protease YdiL (CAAX protease family)